MIHRIQQITDLKSLIGLIYTWKCACGERGLKFATPSESLWSADAHIEAHTILTPAWALNFFNTRGKHKRVSVVKEDAHYAAQQLRHEDTWR